MQANTEKCDCLLKRFKKTLHPEPMISTPGEDKRWVVIKFLYYNVG